MLADLPLQFVHRSTRQEPRVQPAWDNEALRRVCEVKAEAEATLGVEVAAQLRARFADLRAAESPEDLVAGQPELIEQDPPTLKVQLGGGIDLVAVSNHRHHPKTGSGSTDWSRVRRFRVVSITGMSDV